MVKPISDKRREENKIYKRENRAYLREHPQCERCGKPSTEIHHRYGRGVNFLVIETWSASCRRCNRWAAEHPREAREEGWICPLGLWMSRLSAEQLEHAKNWKKK